MKPFYGIDRTTLKKNTFHEGDCFIAATVSDMTRQSYERALQSAAKELEATKLNPVLRGLKTVCSWITLFVFLIFRGTGCYNLLICYDDFSICRTVYGAKLDVVETQRGSTRVVQRERFRDEAY